MSHALCRSVVRGTGVLAVVAAAALATAPPALAHVTAHSSDATQGGTAVLTLRVPDESTTAGTVKLEVKVPTQYAITAARTTPVAGWTATISRTALNPPVRQGDETVAEAVSQVTWTADAGTRIKPDEFLDFPLSLGPLPRVEQLVLPATQTYDDGHAVAWDQPPTTGPESEHPAPVVALAPAPADASADGMSGMSGHAGHTAGSGTTTTDVMTSTDGTARWLGIGGLLLGALGLGIGLRTAVRGRRTAG